MSLDGAGECDWPGCGARRRQVNHWFVVTENALGVQVYRWETCPEKAMKEGKHLCGLAHMSQHVSNVLTPDETKADRESTLELKPPLTREGTKPDTEEAQKGSQDESLDN